MTAFQLSIFAENKPGRLAAVTRVLAQARINIRATTIATSDTFGVINLIVDDPQRARDVLAAAGLTARLQEVIGVLIPDRPGGLDGLTQLLAAEGVNIENAYGFVLEGGKKAVFVLEVREIAKTRELLAAHTFQVLDTEALAALEPFSGGK